MSRKRYQVSSRISSDVLALSNYKCFYCRADFTNENRATLDHIHPVINGGKDRLENLVAACGKCNSLKGARTITNFVGGKKKLEEAAKIYLNLTDFELKVLRLIRKVKKYLPRRSP